MWRAVLIMVVGMSLIPAGDSAGKTLVAAMGVAPEAVAWGRFALGALLVAPLLRAGDFACWADWRVWLRAALLAGGINAILRALETAPIASVFGAFFTGPIIAYALSAWLLGERTSLPRTALLLIGFGGVLMVVQPGPAMEPGLLWAMLAGAFYGAFLTASKWLATAARPIALLFSQLGMAALMSAPLGALAVPWVGLASPGLAVLFLLSGALSMLGNLLLILALRMGESTRLAPFVYFQLVAATVLGVAIFGSWPGPLALAGLALLVVSGFASLGLRAERA
ncbi:MAG: DMT family transporter [Shimia sp.]